MPESHTTCVTRLYTRIAHYHVTQQITSVEHFDRLRELRGAEVRLEVFEEAHEEALQRRPALFLRDLQELGHEVAVGGELEPREGEGRHLQIRACHSTARLINVFRYK